MEPKQITAMVFALSLLLTACQPTPKTEPVATQGAGAPYPGFHCGGERPL